jgi:putative transposase
LHALVRRAQIVLACADAEPNNRIAKRMKLSNATVGKWRRRCSDLRIEGSDD